MAEMQKDSEFEKMVEQRINESFRTPVAGGSINDERLKEMNKKLPAWSLEPPFSFLK